MRKNLLSFLSLLVILFSCSPENEVEPQVNNVTSGTLDLLLLKEIKTPQGKTVTK